MYEDDPRLVKKQIIALAQKLAVVEILSSFDIL